MQMLSAIWLFIQDQILGMKWLNTVINSGLSVLGLDTIVDLGSLVLLMSIFGTKVAVVYVVVGLIIAVVGGTIIEKLHMENHVEEFIRNAKSSIDIESPDLTVKDRLVYAKEQVAETFKKVFPYILAGVGIGAVIHNWIPETWIQTILGSSNPFGVVLAVLVGIPMYAEISMISYGKIAE